MKLPNLPVSPAIAAVLALALAGCDRTDQSTDPTMGERMDSATDQMGAAADDARITAKVKAAIADDPGLGEALAIDVDTEDGVVTLSGEVDSPDVIDRATVAARGVEGVRMVTNRLTLEADAAGNPDVAPPAGADAALVPEPTIGDQTAAVPAPGADDTASVGEQFDDATLTARVKTALASEPGLGEAMTIDVDSENGTVTLSGTVESQSVSDRAIATARSVEGVREVRNELAAK